MTLAYLVPHMHPGHAGHKIAAIYYVLAGIMFLIGLAMLIGIIRDLFRK